MKILPFVTFLLLLSFINAQSNQTCKVPVVTVAGKGSAFGTPNMATFTVQISTTSNTSLQAAQTTNNKMTQVIQILNRNNVPAANIQTSSLSISPKYDYSSSRYPYPIIGQEASTSVSVKINNIDANGSAVGTLYDQLSNIDGVSINGLSFDIQNKSSLRTSARAQAYQQARTTATQFSSFGGYNLGQPQLISEQVSEVPIVFERMQFAQASMVTASPQVSTAVTTGSFLVEINTVYTFFLV